MIGVSATGQQSLGHDTDGYSDDRGGFLALFSGIQIIIGAALVLMNTMNDDYWNNYSKGKNRHASGT